MEPPVAGSQWAPILGKPLHIPVKMHFVQPSRNHSMKEDAIRDGETEIISLLTAVLEQLSRLFHCYGCAELMSSLANSWKPSWGEHFPVLRDEQLPYLACCSPLI